MTATWARGGFLLLLLALVVFGAIRAETRRQEQRVARANPVAEADIERLRVGASERAVIAALGPPDDIEAVPPRGRRLLYYKVEAGSAGDRWQLVFDKGKLSARRRL